MDAAVLPAALGLVTASALVIGIHEISAIEIIFISKDLPLISIDGTPVTLGNTSVKRTKCPRYKGYPHTDSRKWGSDPRPTLKNSNRVHRKIG